MRKKPIDKNYIFSLLSFDQATGEFTWLVSRGTVKSGKRAGTPQIGRGKEYAQIKIDKRVYLAHHLAWLFTYKEWPAHDIDHIDGDGTNNRPENLRKCDMSQNKANSKTYKNNTSGFKCVVLDKQSGKWYCTIQWRGKRQKSPRFNTPEEAHEFYISRSKELFGAFARAA